MSDFFTKKQRKFWCDTCKLFIEYTKLSIDQHNRSKNHLRLVNRDIEYKSQKAKFLKMHGMGSIETQNPIGNLASNAQPRNQQIDPLTGHLPEDKFLNKKTPRDKNLNFQQQQKQNSNLNNQQVNNRNNNYSLNAILFDEVRKEKMKTEMNQSTLNLISRSWVMFWDYTYNLPYYYNNFTGASQWEKPAEFDYFAHNPQQVRNNLNQIPMNVNSNINSNLSNNFNNTNNNNKLKEEKENSDSESQDEIEEQEECENSLEQADAEENKETAGIIGKWEEVEKDQSVFASKKPKDKEDANENFNNDKAPEEERSVDSDEEKVKNVYFIPGLMNKEEFLLNEYGDEFNDEGLQSDEAGFGFDQKDKGGLENIENLEDRNTNYLRNEVDNEENDKANKVQRNEKKELSKSSS